MSSAETFSWIGLIKEFFVNSIPPFVDQLLPKGTKGALDETRLKVPPTNEEIAIGWARARSVYEKVERTLLDLAKRFDDEAIPANIRNLFTELSADIVRTGKNLDEGVSNSQRLESILAQGMVIGGSQFLTARSPRKSYWPRQSASNVVSLLKAFGQFFSGVAGAEQTRSTIAMRYGISAATYFGLFIQLFIDILDQPKAVQNGYRAGTVLGNLVALLVLFVKPLLKIRNCTWAIDEFARSIPNDPTDLLHVFANGLWAEADTLQELLGNVKKIDESSIPSNAAHDEFVAYQTKLSRIIEYFRKIALGTLTEDQRADIAGRTLSAEERAGVAAEIGGSFAWDQLSITQRADAFKFGPPLNKAGPKTAQPVIANLVMLTNIALSVGNPELIADYVVLGVMLNIILWTSRDNAHHDAATTTRLLVENALPSLFALLFITYELVRNRDQLYFDKHPDAALASTYQMLGANLGYANLVAQCLQSGIKLIVYISQSGWNGIFASRSSGEATGELRNGQSEGVLPSNPDPEVRDG